MSLSIADTTDFGILRCIVADYEKAKAILTDAGYSVKVTDVIAVSVADQPGALAAYSRPLSDNGIGLEYLYSFFRNHGDHALIIIRVGKPELAVGVLKTQASRCLRRRIFKRYNIYCDLIKARKDRVGACPPFISVLPVYIVSGGAARVSVQPDYH